MEATKIFLCGGIPLVGGNNPHPLVNAFGTSYSEMKRAFIRTLCQFWGPLLYFLFEIHLYNAYYLVKVNQSLTNDINLF